MILAETSRVEKNSSQEQPLISDFLSSQVLVQVLEKQMVQEPEEH